MYFTSPASPQRCPLISASPHQAPISCVPPGSVDCSVDRCGTGRTTAVSERFVTISSSFGPARPASSPAEVLTEELVAGAGSLQNESAFTVRESRYHGGRKRKRFPVVFPGVRNEYPISRNGFRLKFSRRRMTVLSTTSSATVNSVPPTGVVTRLTNPVSFLKRPSSSSYDKWS